MIYLVKDSVFKKSINGIRMDEFADGMFPFKNIYIVCEDNLRSSAANFQKNIKSQEIFSQVLSEDNADGFKDVLNEDDCLLAISKKGNDEFVRRMVIIALRKNIKVYGVCEDFKSGLAMLSNNSLIIEEDFEANVIKFLKKLRMIINGEPTGHPPKGRLLSSTMRGVVVKINVDVGDVIRKGDSIFVIEAMKMENDLLSEIDGVVSEILVENGDAISLGDPLIRIMEMS